MRSERDRTDVVVVGGGLAGLTAGAYLARAGFGVRVLERASSLGGRGATLRQDGFALNRGPHALYRSGEALRVLRELGVDVPAKRVPAGGKSLRGGELFQLPGGALSLLTTGLLGWRAKAECGQWLQQAPRLRPEDHAHESVTEWLRRAFTEPDARAFIESIVRVSTYSNAPDSFSAATALGQLQKALRGVLYVDGGWQTLVDGLAARATGWGARIALGARAEALAPDGQRGIVVRLSSGEDLRARAVVLAVSPGDVAELLASAGATVPSLDRVVPVRVATLDVALARVPRPEERFVLGVDRPLYLSVHSAVAKVAPEGAGMIHVAKYLRGDEADPDADRRELEALLDLAQPGWRADLVHAQYLPRITVAERLDLAREGGARGRPTAEVSALPGVVLAGDWVQGGSHLVDAALATARSAAELVTGRLELTRAVA